MDTDLPLSGSPLDLFLSWQMSIDVLNGDNLVLLSMKASSAILCSSQRTVCIFGFVWLLMISLLSGEIIKADIC